MIKYINIVILLVLLGLGALLKEHLHISTNLLSLFATQKSLEKFQIANKLGYSKELLIAVKGFDTQSKKEIKEIAKKLRSIKHIRSIHYLLTPSEAITKYYKTHYPIIADFKPFAIDKKEVEQKLNELYKQTTSAFYIAINKSDPLEMFRLNLDKSSSTHRGDLLTLGSYGYLIQATTDVAPANLDDAKELYDEIHKLLGNYSDAISFAPFYYTVENSKAFKADVRYIAALSTIVLILLYAVLIKNIGLLFQTLLTLTNSMLFASLVSMLFIKNFNVLSLAFGMSLSAVSIDYLLHYYFHNFYQKAKKIDKNVFFGFLTTITAFGIFAFIPIPLISQISIFALLSLSFAYVVFTFVFPKLPIKPYTPKQTQKIQPPPFTLPASAVLLLSLGLLLYSALHFKLDKEIKNLDYQNSHLQHIRKIFVTNTKSDRKPVVVQAATKEELIEHLHQLHTLLPKSFSFASFIKDKKSCEARKKELKEYDFKTIKNYIKEAATKAGFREHYFDDAYNFTSKLPSCDIPNLDIFKSYALPLYHDKNRYYTIALVDNEQKAKSLAFVHSLDAKEILQNSTRFMYESIVRYGVAVLLVIFALLLVSVKRRFIYALDYILFPLGVTLAFLVSVGSVNVMHLFSLIILVAIGIDYGIYMSDSEKKERTMLAIKYSLLSTFAAFGVLIFSSIAALHSIGIVITLGCAAIYILIKVMR